MKIFIKILAIVLPACVLVNLINFSFNNGDNSSFFGFHDLAEYISTFNGLGNTLKNLESIKENIVTIRYGGVSYETGSNILLLMWNIFGIPFHAINDIFSNLTWLIGIFFK